MNIFQEIIQCSCGCVSFNISDEGYVRCGSCYSELPAIRVIGADEYVDTGGSSGDIRRLDGGGL